MSHDELTPLADVPPPRRSDDAFARSVADGVQRRRQAWRALFALPAFAAATAGFLFLVMRPTPPEETPVVAVNIAPAAGTSVTVAVAIADPFEDEDALFALPMLDGSSDEELARLDRMLDQKLSAQRGER